MHWTTEGSTFDSRHRKYTFPFSKASRSALGHTGHPVPLVPGYNVRGVKIYTHHLVPKSTIRVAIPPFPCAFMARKRTLPFISIHTPIYSHAHRVTLLRRQISVILHIFSSNKSHDMYLTPNKFRSSLIHVDFPCSTV